MVWPGKNASNLAQLFNARQLVRVILLLLVIFPVSACFNTPKTTLRIGTNIWLGYEPLYIARSKDLIKPVDVKLVEYVSATQVMRGLVDGIIDAGALTLDEAILLHQQGMDIHIVLVMDFSDGADALLARPNIKDLKSLRGQRVGVETTALGAYIMHRALEKANLQIDDVKLIPIEFSEHEQAYKQGLVDAVVTFEPVRSRLLEQGANSLLDSSQLPGEVVDVLVIRADRSHKYKRQLKKLLDTWFKTLDYIKSSPEAAARDMTQRLKLDVPDVLKAISGVKYPEYKENRGLLATNPARLLEQTRKLSDVMLKSNLISGAVRVHELYDEDLLQYLYQ